MTYDDFKAKHKENVLKGFDDIDGRDYWAEFKADLHTLLADERKPLELQIDALKKRICAGICGVDFPGFVNGEHMPRCPFRTPCKRAHAPVSIPALYEDGIKSIQCGNCDIQVPLIPPTTEKQKCDECGKPCDCTNRAAQHLNHLCRSKYHDPGWYE